MNKRKILTVPFILCCLLGILFALQNKAGRGLRPVTGKEGDYLFYVISPRSPNSQLMMYDPAENTHVPILSDWNVRGLSVSSNGHLAFSSLREGDRKIYVMDYPFSNDESLYISDSNSDEYYPTSWSPNGRYLAYVAFQDDENILSIWDGERSTRIFHSRSEVSELVWSQKDQLAFTIVNTLRGNDSEIYIWEGEDAVNLNQNLTGRDRFPAWNEDGYLAFLSQQSGTHDILIWDGTLTDSGLPDANSFQKVSSSLISSASMPVWSNSGSLTFRASEPGDEGRQIYEWDGVDTVNISRNPGFYNGEQRWRGDGYWSFTTSVITGRQLIYIRDERNITRLTLEGYGFQWSDSGYFFLCQKTVKIVGWQFTELGLPRLIKEYRGGWTLLMGDGSKIVEVAQGREIEAVWSNGNRVVCTGR